MSIKTIDFESLTDGTTLTGDNTGFTDVLGAASMRASTTRPADGTVGARIEFTANSQAAQGRYIIPEGVTPRMSVSFKRSRDTALQAVPQIIRFYNGTAKVVALRPIQDGRMTILINDAPTAAWVSTGTLPTGVQVRHALWADTATGAVTYAAYTGNSTTPLTGLTWSTTGLSLGAGFTEVQMFRPGAASDVGVEYWDSIRIKTGTDATTFDAAGWTAPASALITATKTAAVRPGEQVGLVLGGGTTATLTQTAGKPVQIYGAGATRSFVAPYTLRGDTLTFAHTVQGETTPATASVAVIPAARRVKANGVMAPVKRHLPVIQAPAPTIAQPTNMRVSEFTANRIRMQTDPLHVTAIPVGTVIECLWYEVGTTSGPVGVTTVTVLEGGVTTAPLRETGTLSRTNSDGSPRTYTYSMEARIGSTVSARSTTASIILAGTTTVTPPTVGTIAGTPTSTSMSWTYTVNPAATIEHTLRTSAGGAVVKSYTGASATTHQVTYTNLTAGTYTPEARFTTATGGTVLITGTAFTITAQADQITAYVQEARTYYPDGTGEWAHQPHYTTWKPIYWLPDDGIPFTPPTNPDGSVPLVMRGQRCRGGSTAVLNYTGGTNCAIVICPRVFTNETLGTWGEVDMWRGVIVQGFHMKNPSFLGHADWATYKSEANATAQTSKVTPVRPGYWRYNPWDTGLTGDAATIDNRPGVGRMHERSLYLRPGSGVSTEKSFYALEGTYLEGDWVVEGLNVNGINSTGNTRVVVAGYRHDRVSVYFRKDSADTTYGGKWPGGDSMQWFGAINDIVVIGGTALTHYQAQFMQHSSRKLITVHDWNSRVPDLAKDGDATYYGGSGGNQVDFGSSRDSWVNYDFRNFYVWRNGAGTVDPPLFPEIKSELVPDKVKPTDRIGVAYAANPVPLDDAGRARIAAYQPFPADDIWNMPIPVDATFAADTDPMVKSMQAVKAWINQGQYGHQMDYATTADPLFPFIEDIGSSGANKWRSSYGYVPLTTMAAGGTDAHAHVLQPDGKTLLEMIGFRWADPPAGYPMPNAFVTKVPQVTRVHRVDLTKSSLGPQNGVRAWAGSAIGGLIRVHEVDPTHPMYTNGDINHVLAMAPAFFQLKFERDTRFADPWGYHSSGVTDQTGQPGHKDGQPRYTTWIDYDGANFVPGKMVPAGTPGGVVRPGSRRAITRYPALENDWNGANAYPNGYGGNIPYGQLFAIPAGTPKPSNLTAQGGKMWDACVNYGARAVDTTGYSGPGSPGPGSGDTNAFFVEVKAPTAWRSAIVNSGGSFVARDLQLIRDALRPVLGERWDQPAGAPVSAPRRRPLAGPVIAVPTTELPDAPTPTTPTTPPTPTTLPGVDYSSMTTAATFTTTATMTRLSGTGTTQLATVPALDTGQTTAVRTIQTAANSQTTYETPLTTPVNLTDAYLRMAVRFPPTAEVYPAGDGTAATKSDLRWIDLRVAENKTQHDAGHYIQQRVALATYTQLGSSWAYITLEPALATTTGTPNLASIGYARIMVDAFRTTNGNTVVDFGHIQRLAHTADMAQVVIGWDDGDARHYTNRDRLRGLPVTLYLTPATQALTLAQVKELHDVYGWQVGTHAYGNHITPASPEELRANLEASLAWQAANNFQGGLDFAHWGPGSNNVGLPRTPENMAVIRSLFRSARNTESGPSVPESLPLANQYVSKCWLIGDPNGAGNTLADVQAFIEKAIKTKGLAEFCWHGDPTAIFDGLVDWLLTQQAAGRLRVVTKAQALAA